TPALTLFTTLRTREAHHLVVLKRFGARQADVARPQTEQRRHRRFIEEYRIAFAIAVKAGGHSDAIGPQHTDFDIVAFGHIRRQPERPRHMVDGITGRTVE